MKPKNTNRIRGRLLILLWIWAACMFMVVDLFRNVTEFDSVRPRARWYRAARYTAHKMVGEPYYGGDFAERLEAAPVTRKSNPLRDALVAVHEERSSEGLREHVTQGFDPRVRIAALRAMARRFESGAREILLEVVRNKAEVDRVRAEAARLIGRTGHGAYAELDSILRSDFRAPIKAGAVLGLGESGTAIAAERALALTDGRLRTAAVKAIGRMSNSDATYILAPASREERRGIDVRVAICSALAASKDEAAVRPLTDLLADPLTPPPIRGAAAAGLGRMGYRQALPIVAAACDDSSPEVSRQARIAKTRLQHVSG